MLPPERFTVCVNYDRRKRKRKQSPASLRRCLGKYQRKASDNKRPDQKTLHGNTSFSHASSRFLSANAPLRTIAYTNQDTIPIAKRQHPTAFIKPSISSPSATLRVLRPHGIKAPCYTPFCSAESPSPHKSCSAPPAGESICTIVAKSVPLLSVSSSRSLFSPSHVPFCYGIIKHLLILVV